MRRCRFCSGSWPNGATASNGPGRFLRGGVVDNRIAQVATALPAQSPALIPIAGPIWTAAGLGAAEVAGMRAVTAAFNAANPRNLVAIEILRRAANPDAPTRPDWTALPTAPLALPGPALPAPVPQDSLGTADRALLHWLDTAAGTEPKDLAPTLWRILVHWPAGLRLIACRIEPVWRDGTIARHAQHIGRDARSLVQSMPHQPAVPPDPSTAAFVAAVADAFLAKLPAMIAVGARVSDCLEGDPDV